MMIFLCNLRLFLVSLPFLMPLKIVTIFTQFFSLSQLGWTLLLARTLTGFADSLVMTKL